MLPTGMVAVVDARGRFVYGVGKHKNALPGSLNANGAHRLLVIDVDDDEQMARLARCYLDANAGVANTASMVKIRLVNALREFARPEPPKPEEPKLRWARVLDDKGREWCRTEWDDGLNKPWQHEGIHAHWQAVDVVRILSPGVSPEESR
jgi:hypothetical protein